MITLAIELSTSRGELALLEDDRVLVEREWLEDRQHRQQIFAQMAALTDWDGFDFGRIDLLAVGVGPGAFSGLRMAVSALRAMALPDGKPVFGVASAEALAWDTMREKQTDSVAVFGDARRNELWAGRFRCEHGLAPREGDWLVAQPGTLQTNVVGLGTVWVTSDWGRIGTQIRTICPAGVTLIEEPRWPKARSIGRLAAAKRRAGFESEPLTPLYLHPAVSVLPTF